jgi:hypothetical protein
LPYPSSHPGPTDNSAGPAGFSYASESSGTGQRPLCESRPDYGIAGVRVARADFDDVMVCRHDPQTGHTQFGPDGGTRRSPAQPQPGTMSATVPSGRKKCTIGLAAISCAWTSSVKSSHSVGLKQRPVGIWAFIGIKFRRAWTPLGPRRYRSQCGS